MPAQHSRRSFLARSAGVLGAAAAAAAGGTLLDLGLGGGGSAHAATTLPVTFQNQTGSYPDNQAWAYVVGVAPGGQQCYVRADGTLVPVSPSLNGSDGYADLSIPFAASGDTTLSLPNMSGRIYFSLGEKLKFKVVTDGNGNNALQYPAGWVSGDPSYNVLHDWIEFTFNDTGMYCNTTMVDMFSIPLSIKLTGGSGTQTTGQLVPGGRDGIFSALAGQSDPSWSKLIVGDRLRVIAPGHGIDTGVFPSGYYDSYIDQVWSQYAGEDLSVTVSGTAHTGRVSGGSLVFDGGAASFGKPKTSDVFYCAGALAPGAGISGPLAAQLGAAFNRSTLLTHPTQPVTDAGQFYLSAPTNVYSQVMHQHTVDGKAYGFPFDDAESFAAYVQDTAPTAMTVDLTSFTD
ncbi:beta-1,3-glucanase family protein [Phaeacidiphilus oryzae]|uniref:beta-1,3-glucanase family protein n=1 Tax=Phaeacidiphilus oryzae TaxID=348818 RepID=UPI00056C6AFD|nr:beta-1,3-glucanase family protein [Phaeacidiphilus oryzae]